VVLDPEHYYRLLLRVHVPDIDCQRTVHATRTTSVGVALAATAPPIRPSPHLSEDLFKGLGRGPALVRGTCRLHGPNSVM